MPVARGDIRVPGMHVEVALRLVKAHGREFSGQRIGKKKVRGGVIAKPSVSQAPGALDGVMRALLPEVVEGLVVVLKVRDFWYRARVREMPPRK